VRPLPRISVTTWWQDEAWLRWVRDTANYFSEHQYTHVVISPAVETASVNLETKLIMVTSQLPQINATITIRKAPGLHRVKLLRAFLAHECAHIRFTSKAKPKGTLGWLYNALEDERIERRMTEHYAQLGPLFRELGDIYLSEAQGPLNALSACLVWRWAFDHPEKPMRCEDPLWEAVRPLVEQAWREDSSEGVLVLAQKILGILGGQEPDQGLPNLSAPCAQQDSSAGTRQRSNPPHDDGDKDSDGEDVAAEILSRESPYPEDGSDSFEEGGVSQVESSKGKGDMPNPPDISLERGREQLESLLKQVEPYAWHLGRTLMPPLERQGYVSHKSRGRFDFERYQRGDERYFLKKLDPQHRPLGITLLLDLSASMNDPVRLQTAKLTSLMLHLACTLAGIPLEIVGFNVTAFRVKNLQDEFEQVALTLAGLRGVGGTELYPALQLVEQPIAIIVSDGELSPQDVAASRAFAKQQPTFYMPFLIDTIGAESYRTIFGRMIMVQDLSRLCYEVEHFLEALVQSSYL
jgi:hypothetical protein